MNKMLLDVQMFCSTGCYFALQNRKALSCYITAVKDSEILVSSNKNISDTFWYIGKNMCAVDSNMKPI